MTAIDVPVTANAILFGSPDRARSLEDSLAALGFISAVTAGAPHLTGDMQNALRHEISTATTDLLSLDLVDVLVTGWRKHAALVAAASRTAAALGSSEVVELATHHITATHRPYIDLYIDDVRDGRIHLELQLGFTVAALVAVIRTGQLVAVQSGHCTIAATLLVQGQQVAARSAHWDLPLVVRLGNGIPLLPNDALRLGKSEGAPKPDNSPLPRAV